MQLKKRNFQGYKILGMFLADESNYLNESLCDGGWQDHHDITSRTLLLAISVKYLKPIAIQEEGLGQIIF